jgi:hypothetical protein
VGRRPGRYQGHHGNFRVLIPRGTTSVFSSPAASSRPGNQQPQVVHLEGAGVAGFPAHTRHPTSGTYRFRSGSSCHSPLLQSEPEGPQPIMQPGLHGSFCQLKALGDFSCRLPLIVGRQDYLAVLGGQPGQVNCHQPPVQDPVDLIRRRNLGQRICSCLVPHAGAAPIINGQMAGNRKQPGLTAGSGRCRPAGCCHARINVSCTTSSANMPSTVSRMTNRRSPGP